MHHIRINGSHLSCSIERICIILVISSSLIVRAGHGSTQAYACLKPGSRLIVSLQTCSETVIIRANDISFLIQIAERRENIILFSHSIRTGCVFLTITCALQCLQPIQIIVTGFYLCYELSIFIEHGSTVLIKDRRKNNVIIDCFRCFECLLRSNSTVFFPIALHTGTHSFHPLVYAQFVIFRYTTGIHTLLHTNPEVQLMTFTFFSGNHDNSISSLITIKSGR